MAEWQDMLFEHSVPLGIGLILYACCLAAVAVSYRRHLTLRRGNLALVALRMAFLLLLGWCLLQPFLRRTDVASTPPHLLVALDTSESMGQAPDPNTPSRWMVSAEILSQPWVTELEQQFKLEVYPFDADLGMPVSAVEGGRFKPSGKASLVKGSLRKLVDRFRGQHVAALVLLSDGLDTRDVLDDWALGPWPCPVYTVELEPPGRPSEEPDLAVERVETPTRVNAGWSSALTAVVSATGTGGGAFTVQLLRDGLLLEEQPSQVPAGGGRREVRFTVQHDIRGDYTYAVNVPPFPGERHTNDNFYAVGVNVVDPRNRLLYVEGPPRWESKYLVRALQANPDVAALAFIQGPEGRFLTYGERGDMDLRLDLPQLRRYKIAVVGDLDQAALESGRSEALVRFVEEGGSLILVAGPKAAGPDGWGKTALAQVLPASPTGVQPVREGKYGVQLTAEGEAHPVFTAGDGGWQDLPPVLTVYTADPPSPGAQALLTAETEAGSKPLLLVQRYGQGKVALLLTDSLWRWRLDPGQREPYGRFWRQLIAWLLPAEQDVAPYEIDLFANLDQALIGDTVFFSARLGGSRVETLDGIEVTCEIETPEPRRMPFPMAPQPVMTTAGTRLPGYGLSYQVALPGLYRATAVAMVGGARIASTPFTLFVKPHTPETSPRPADAELLRTLASASGGRYCRPGELSGVLHALNAKPRQGETVSYRSLWSRWPVLFFLLLLLCTEWVLRKMRNLA